MPIPATTSVTTGLFGTPAAPADGTTEAAKSGNDKDMFLQLLVAQMRYQDPMNPTDSSQFLAQSAQFTALEKMQDVADRTAQLLSTQMAFGASGLIARQVEWVDATGATKAGQVGGVTFTADGPMLQIDGTSVPLASVRSVALGSSNSHNPAAS